MISATQQLPQSGYAAPPAMPEMTYSKTPPVEQQQYQKPLRVRGGGEGGDICCGLCAGLACFECLKCCC
ncbi:hypothetical protein BX070DRAFT_228385 [Coemansia spiralis]|nr:hypothetical protein BX070DRAFT_228385 [Coemansia spiralis]